jgi:surface carbohydrate biosynthesis protein
MGASRKSLILPCETRNREFDSKLLLACVAAERGFDAYLGAKREINISAARLPRSIYVQKSLSKRSYRMYDILDRVGHWIVSTDEEGIVYQSLERYWQIKIHPRTLHKVRALFAWGADNERIWRTHPAFHGAPIEVSGNPRIDLLRPELRSYFQDQADELRERFGSFVLVNSNFTLLNHFFPKWSRSRILVEDPEQRRSATELEVDSAFHWMSLFRAFQEMLPVIARRFPDRCFVVRPHPSESHDAWKQAAAGLPNVHVLHEGNIVPWLHAAEAIVHTGCTTALEAYVVGTPAIAYQPVADDRYDMELPNAVSYLATDLSELTKLLEATFDGVITSDREEEARKRAVMDEFIAGRSGRLVCDRMVDALERLELEWRKEPAPSPWRRASGRFLAEIRAVEKWINLLRPGHNNNRVYVQHMFSDLSLADVETGLARLRPALGRFSEVQVTEISHNVFRLRS